MAKSRNTRKKAPPTQKKPPANNRRRVWVVVNSAIAAAIVGAGGSIAASQLGSSGGAPAPQESASPRIEVDDVQVQDDSGDTALVTVLLRNTGNQIAIIKSAIFTIQRSTILPLCLSQGALGSSGTYGVTVPADPRPGTDVVRPTSLQEQPDSADKFSFQLHLQPGPLRGLSFYEMKMTLAYDNARAPVNAGTLLISLPEDPDGRYVWTKTDQATHMAGQGATASQIAGYSHCLVGNATAIRPLLAATGATRSPVVSALQAQIAYCCVLTDPDGSDGS